MEQLGIEPKLLVAQIVNFAIIVVVLTKLLYKPILTMLDKRKKEIEEGLALTEKLQREEEKLTTKSEKVLAVARAEAQAIIEEAKKQAKEVEKELIEEAHRESANIIERGRGEVESLRERMQKDVQHEAIVLAVAMAKKLLASLFTAKEQHQLISQHLKELELLPGKVRKKNINV